jgi:hypothetical protein
MGAHAAFNAFADAEIDGNGLVLRCVRVDFLWKRIRLLNRYVFHLSMLFRLIKRFHPEIDILVPALTFSPV